MMARMSTPNVILYGIAGCDTVRKARAWLTERGVPHEFHDFRRQGVPAGRLDGWLERLGAERLLNRRGTTWRALDAAAQARAADAAGVAALLREHPTLIRRPVAEWGDAVSAGFDEAAWNERLGARS